MAAYFWNVRGASPCPLDGEKLRENGLDRWLGGFAARHVAMFAHHPASEPAAHICGPHHLP